MSVSDFKPDDGVDLPEDDLGDTDNFQYDTIEKHDIGELGEIILCRMVNCVRSFCSLKVGEENSPYTRLHEKVIISPDSYFVCERKLLEEVDPKFKDTFAKIMSYIYFVAFVFETDNGQPANICRNDNSRDTNEGGHIIYNLSDAEYNCLSELFKRCNGLYKPNDSENEFTEDDIQKFIDYYK